MKKQKIEIQMFDAYNNIIKVKGEKMRNGKLLIPNPFYKPRIPIIEKRPDT